MFYYLKIFLDDMYDCFYNLSLFLIKLFMSLLGLIDGYINSKYYIELFGTSILNINDFIFNIDMNDDLFITYFIAIITLSIYVCLYSNNIFKYRQTYI